jgi:hypothetical protein
MTRMIGGPLHGRDMEVKAETLFLPIVPNSRTPKQQRGRFTNGVYKKVRYYAGGEKKTVYRFTFGYYEPERLTE